MLTVRRLLIFPLNGNALEAVDCIGTQFELVGFVDDTPEKQGEDRYGHRVYPREALSRFPDAKVLAVPGSPSSYLSRRKVIQGLNISADRFASVVHPTASLSRLATIGRNVLIMAGVVVTSNARIGDHVCILPNTVIHHDVEIGDWSLIGSNAILAGASVIGQNCYLASGSSVMHGVRIGDRAMVGLGSNVTRSVPPDATVAGNPARPIPQTKEPREGS